MIGSPLFAGELPELFEKPWTAWYCGYEGKSFNFGVDPDGNASIIPVKKDEWLSQALWITIRPVIEEVLPGGRVVSKQNQPDGWEAVTESSEEAEKVHYRGTVTGGATYEIFYEVDGSEIRGGGRILDKGELTENPIRLSIRVMVPNVYRHTEDEEVLERKTKRDRVDLVMADGEKNRFDVLDVVDASEMTGKGVRSARIDLSRWDGSRLELEAGDAGLFEFQNGGKKPVYKGFTLGWMPEPAKNPEGEARFVIEFK